VSSCILKSGVVVNGSIQVRFSVDSQGMTVVSALLLSMDGRAENSISA